MYISKYFGLNEILYPKLYKRLRDNGRINNAWFIFDPMLLLSADLIREFIGSSIVINSYTDDKVICFESGLREFDTKIGADLSMHKFGNAFDLKFNTAKWNPEKLRIHMESIGCFKNGFKTNLPPMNITKILKGVMLSEKGKLIDFIYNELNNKVSKDVIPFIFLTCIEWMNKDSNGTKMTWFHMDTRNSTEDKIKIVTG